MFFNLRTTLAFFSSNVTFRACTVVNCKQTLPNHPSATVFFLRCKRTFFFSVFSRCTEHSLTFFCFFYAKRLCMQQRWQTLWRGWLLWKSKKTFLRVFIHGILTRMESPQTTAPVSVAIAIDVHCKAWKMPASVNHLIRFAISVIVGRRLLEPRRLQSPLYCAWGRPLDLQHLEGARQNG